MAVQEHNSQHDEIEELPLVTESATVTEVERLDRTRLAEVDRVLSRMLEETDLPDTDNLPRTPADWHTLVADLSHAGHEPVARRVATLRDRVQRPKPMLVRARLEMEREFDYVAGQYIGLRYGKHARAYSLASSPTREGLEVCVRRVPDGRVSPRICEDLTPNETVTVRGPYGELVLQDASPRDMVFLATGTGVAPFKGMIDYVFDTGYDTVDGHQRDVWLFLGAAWEDDLPYREAFRTLAEEHEHFHFVPCLSREGYLSDWDGERSYVQHTLLKYVEEEAVTAPLGAQLEARLERSPETSVAARLDPSHMEVYACGINAMVFSLVKAVQRLGVPEGGILSEGFG